MTTAPTTPAVLMVLGSCASLQVGAALATRLFPVTGSSGATLLRLALAAGVLIAVARPAVHAWRRHQWGAVVVLGLCMAGMNGFFYAALARLPLGPALAIEFLGPLTVAALLSRRLRDFGWVALALGGIALFGFAGADAALDPLGVGFVLLAALFWGLYIVAGARAGQAVAGTGGVAIALAVAATVLLPIGFHGAQAAFGSPGLVLVALGTGLLASAVPYSLEMAALRRLPKRVFGVLLALEPAVAAVAGWLLLDQSLGWLAVAAISLVVAAGVGSTVSARPAPAPAPAPTPVPA